MSIFLPCVAGPVMGPADQFFSSVVNLSHFDNSMKNYCPRGAAWVNQATPPTLSSTQSKFGGFSLNFASAVAATKSISSDYTLGTGDFTIEFWVYLAGVTTAQNLIDFRPSSGSHPDPTIYVTGGTVRYFSNNVDHITSGASAISVNTWTNIALSRVSAVSRLFINGTQAGSNFSDSINSTDNIIWLPAINNAGIVSGYVDEVRVTKGVGRYSANYTVAALPFPNF